MLVDPERTRYDLNFRFLGFPVRVHPYFWLGAILFGNPWLQAGGLPGLTIWVGCMFVSILVHELGHALAFRWFRTDSHIVLYIFGGLAVPWSGVSGWWRRVLIALAGPAAGFVLLGAVWASNKYTGWAATSLYAGLAYLALYFMNLYWGILNLMPIWPLDGGKVSRELCSRASPHRGKRISLEISLAAAGLLCLYSIAVVTRTADKFAEYIPSWLPGGTVFSAIFFGLLAYESWRLLQDDDWIEGHWDDRPPWKR